MSQQKAIKGGVVALTSTVFLRHPRMNTDVKRVKLMDEANRMEEAFGIDPSFFYKALMRSKEGDGKCPLPDEGAVIDESKPPVVVNCTGDQVRKRGFRGTRDWCKRPGNVYIESFAKRYGGMAEESIWRNPFSVREWGSNMSLGLYDHYVR